MQFEFVLWYCCLGHLTCKGRLPCNLYCVGGDVKPCSINRMQSFFVSWDVFVNHWTLNQLRHWFVLLLHRGLITATLAYSLLQFNTKESHHRTAPHVQYQPWSSERPGVKNYKWRLSPVWPRMLYSLYPYGNSGRQRVETPSDVGLWTMVSYNIAEC